MAVPILDVEASVDRRAADLEEARAFLLEIGEDPNDYSDDQLLNMLAEGF